jgi:hypothetical protein
VPDLPPFQGGAAGYLAYDWGRVLERLPAPRHDDLALPDVVLGLYDWVLAWDHERSRAWMISTGMPETALRIARGERRNALTPCAASTVAGQPSTIDCRRSVRDWVAWDGLATVRRSRAVLSCGWRIVERTAGAPLLVHTRRVPGRRRARARIRLRG